MRYFFIFLMSISSLTSLIAMNPQDEHRIQPDPNLIANLLEGLKKKEQTKSDNPLEVGMQTNLSAKPATDPEEKKKEYENDINNLKDALSLRYPTENIQRRLKKLDNPDMKHIWAEHAPYILASAKTQAIYLEEKFRNGIREEQQYTEVSVIEGNYEIAYANKLAVKRFDAQKMREWFRLSS